MCTYSNRSSEQLLDAAPFEKGEEFLHFVVQRSFDLSQLLGVADSLRRESGMFLQVLVIRTLQMFETVEVLKYPVVNSVYCSMSALSIA